MAEQFCLRWNNFQTNIVSALDSLKSSEDLVDVTLTCEGKNIKAHKVVLSACSPYFRAVFKDNPCQHPIIILKDVLSEDILNLLSYMYQGEVFIEENKLSSFLHTAALLQIKGLCGEPNQESNIFVQNPLNHTLRHNHCNQITISPKFPPKDVPASTVKRRRNSATDRFSDTNFKDQNKKYKSTLDKSELVPTNNTESSAKETEELAGDKSRLLPSQQGEENVKTELIPDAIVVKHEMQEDDGEALSTDALEKESLYEGDQTDVVLPHPHYENSMLARSLLSANGSNLQNNEREEFDKRCPAHRPATCSYCGKRFSRSANLRRHLKAVHDIDQQDISTFVYVELSESHKSVSKENEDNIGIEECLN